jgi:phosphatidylglycerophosphate synthase
VQLVIAIPESVAHSFQEASASILRPVCGMPLLTRVLVTAVRAGVDTVLLIWPETIPSSIREKALSSRLLRDVPVLSIVSKEHFDPSTALRWQQIAHHIEPQFLWMPWNWVTVTRHLSELRSQSATVADWSRPVLIGGAPISYIDGSKTNCSPADGLAVVSPKTAQEAERYLVRRSGKVLDGIHSSFNRQLCRPLVRWLSHTPITPNAVSVGGLVVAFLSAIAFMAGTYRLDVVGALLFFVAGLFDEMDGMLARIEFMDSPFGCWLEGSVDSITYVLLFGGVAVGLRHRQPTIALWGGTALLFGTLLSLAVTMWQRRLRSSHSRPHEFLGNFYSHLERDSSNAISSIVRRIQPFQKKGVMIHYLFIFTLLGGLEVFFFLAILGSNLTWTLALYFDRRFFHHQHNPGHLSITQRLES